MKFDIPEKCHIRWQAALAVLEDLQEDKKAPFDMGGFADEKTEWVRHCGTAACFAGYISVAPYCRALDYAEDDGGGMSAEYWLLNSNRRFDGPEDLYALIFSASLRKRTRAKTLAFLKTRLKSIFKQSTGKTLTAPLTFYVD